MKDGRIARLHPVHRLIQSLGRDLAVQRRFETDPEAVFQEFGLSKAEVAALKEATMASLARIGVHPILRMHWLMMSDPTAAAHMSVAEYLPKFNAEAANG